MDINVSEREVTVRRTTVAAGAMSIRRRDGGRPIGQLPLPAWLFDDDKTECSNRMVHATPDRWPRRPGPSRAITVLDRRGASPNESRVGTPTARPG